MFIFKGISYDAVLLLLVVVVGWLLSTCFLISLISYHPPADLLIIGSHKHGIK